MEIYHSVLTRITETLDLDYSLAVHPLLGELRWSEMGMETQMDAFNTEETLVVEALVGASSSDFHLCTLTPLKTCDPSEDPVFVILSELGELGEKEIAVVVLLVDHRSASAVQTTRVAHFKARRGGWRIVSFRSAE